MARLENGFAPVPSGLIESDKSRDRAKAKAQGKRDWAEVRDRRQERGMQESVALCVGASLDEKKESKPTMKGGEAVANDQRLRVARGNGIESQRQVRLRLTTNELVGAYSRCCFSPQNSETSSSM